jgi:ATP-binding cassette subfamily B protein
MTKMKKGNHMLKLFKFLNKSILALICVTLLLILQANCDLALPSYTSDIVNTGILKSGINNAIPDVVRKSALDKLALFMNEKDQATVNSHYSPLKKNDYTDKEWSALLSKYPLLSTEELYSWDNEEEAALKSVMATPMILVLSFENDSEEVQQMKQQILAGIPDALKQNNSDIFSILSSLPSESRAAITDKLSEYFSNMPEAMLSQTASAYVKSEYIAIGVNVNSMQINYTLIAGAKMLGLALVAMLASILVTLLAARISAKLGRDLRSGVYQKVLSFSHKEMDQFSTASLITRSTNDIQQVQMLIVMLIRVAIYSPILAFGGIVKVLNSNSSMSWILVVGVGAIFVLIATLFIVAMPKFQKMPKLIDRINLVTREILTGLPVIRAFSTVNHEEKRFDKANIDLTKNNLFVSRVMTFMFPALMLIMNLVSILIIWVGGKGIDQGTMQVGDMIAFIQYTMQIIMSFLMLTMLSIMLPRAVVAAKRIDEVLSTKASILDPEKTETTNTTMKGVLEFSNVSFRYPNADEDVLANISFTANPGETTAIIGSTGSGKSTLINLIPRFYDVTAGNILLDGTDVRNMSQKHLRERLGLVPQKGVLFTGTIESNIKFGKSAIDDEQMEKAARIAQAEEFISSKPEGYDTEIAEGGTNVSGGQKQRLAIARAIAKNPEVYIFDDSFSALDYKTDAALRKTLKEELSDSTVIIVAQRISTIMNAEQILVLDDGRIVGKGTHKELLNNCEVYQQIASSQLSKEELYNE